MKIYPEDYIVAVEVGFTDLNGTAVVPSAVTAALSDGEDQVVSDFGSLEFDPAATSIEVTVPATFNVLGEGELSAARILRVELTTAAGVIRRAFSYIIEGEFRLALMVNSFMSMEAAELLARDMTNVDAWAAASDDRKYASLIEAFNRLTRIPMVFKTNVGGVLNELAQSYRACQEETIIPRTSWPSITEAEFLTWPAYFRKALRTAQLVEADEQLRGDSISRRQRAGIISEKIGESAVTLAGPTKDMGLSRQALVYLAGLVYTSHRITRV